MTINASGIYQIRNLINGKVYVGSATSIRQRILWHIRNLNKGKHHSVLLQRSWNKYGSESFIFEVLELCSKNELIEREQFWLDCTQCYVKGLNIYKTAKSPKGYKHSEETKIKISQSGKGKKKSKETKIKMSEYHKNRSKEHKENMSVSLSKRVFSVEHRKKLSEANKKRKRKSKLVLWEHDW